MTIVLATRNTGKVAEYNALFSDAGIEILSLTDAGVDPAFDAPEPAETFEGNALIKALLYGERTQLPTLAEDSGLCIDALAGRPGVKSARYAPGTDRDRVTFVLEEMHEVPVAERTARFCAVLVYFDPIAVRIEITKGFWEGYIATEVRGERSFGYDPIFIDAVSGKTGSELSLEEKNERSHRGNALRAMRTRLLG